MARTILTLGAIASVLLWFQPQPTTPLVPCPGNSGVIRFSHDTYGYSYVTSIPGPSYPCYVSKAVSECKTDPVTYTGTRPTDPGVPCCDACYLTCQVDVDFDIAAAP